MKLALPSISILFKQLASTAVTRSSKGVVALVVNDATVENTTLYTYSYESEVNKEDFTAENYRDICATFKGNPSKVYVVRCGSTFETAAEVLNTIKFNWLACLVDTMQGDVVSYVKGVNEKNSSRKIKAVVYGVTNPDDMHIVNVANEEVTLVGGIKISSCLYLGRLAGLFAGLPFSRTSTYYALTDLASTKPVDDPDTSVGNGYLVLLNDDGVVKIGRGVNSLVTLADGVTKQDFKKITIVEALDTIQEDISTTFKDVYVGKYKNSLDNQMLFVAAINQYLKTLAKEEALDNDYDNHVEIDVEAQRQALIQAGYVEADAWDDSKVRKHTVSSNVYLKGYIKPLDGMEDLQFIFEC